VPRASSSRDRRDKPGGARPERSRTGLVVARGRRRASPVLARRRRLRGRSTSRDRRRRAGRIPHPCAGIRHGELRRLAADVRPRHHDPDRRRVCRHARPSRLDRRRQGRRRHRGVTRRDDGLERGSRASLAEPSSRHPGRVGVGGIRRPARPAPVAPGARPLAAACSGAGGCACRGAGPCTGPAIGSGARPDSRGRLSAGGSGVGALTPGGAGGGGHPSTRDVSRRRAGPGAGGPAAAVDPTSPTNARPHRRRELDGGRTPRCRCTGARRRNAHGRRKHGHRPGSPRLGSDTRAHGIPRGGRQGGGAAAAADASSGRRRGRITGGCRAPNPRRRGGPDPRESGHRRHADRAQRRGEPRRSTGAGCPRPEGGTARRRLPGPARDRRAPIEGAGRRRRDVGSRPRCRTSKRSFECSHREPRGRGRRSAPARRGRRRRPSGAPRGGSRQVGGP
jgi:hypothetical protein